MNNTIQQPRVTIGMPVYNGERYIEESIRSNLAQSYEDFILYIADNASTDRTHEICNDYASMDKRIAYIRNSHNVGASGNYSICFEPAKSEYFRWSNSDDTIQPTLIEQCVNFLDAHPDFVLVYGKTNIIDENSQFIEHYDDNLNLQQNDASVRFKSFYHNVGLSNILYGLIRRDALINTSLLGNYIASDINLIGELSLYGKFNELQEYLFNRRMHPGCSSWDRSDNEKQKVFWDPSKRNMNLNSYRRLYEYFKSAHNAPISSVEKNKIYLFLLRAIYWNKDDYYREAIEFIKRGFR